MADAAPGDRSDEADRRLMIGCAVVGGLLVLIVILGIAGIGPLTA